MRWNRKARIQRACAAAPFGDRAYRVLQRRFGTLDGDPASRVNHFVDMIEWISTSGVDIDGSKVLEVGTGHKPTMPLLFALSGASVTTVDLNRRLQWDLTADVLAWIREHAHEVAERLTDGLADRFAARVGEVDGIADPRQSFDSLGIEYMAPGDARQMPFGDGTLDVHYSTTTLEHIPEDDLHSILAEARRLLGPGGIALHFVDLSDHFAHQDESISEINFLKFSEAEWARLAGNEFSYCNRLRVGDFERLIGEAGMRVERDERFVDEDSERTIADGFSLDERFAQIEPSELATTGYRFLARPIDAD